MLKSWKDNEVGVRGVHAAGVAMLVMSAIGVVLGWMLVGTLARDFQASIDVSRSAITSIGGTLDLVDEVAEGTASSIDAAARSAASASQTTEAAMTGLSTLADFLDSELPQDIEAIRRALPGAIDAADAVDTTLGALSLFGVDYSPSEPFGESLRRVEGALMTLPDEIRSQSESIRVLIPSAAELADDSEGVSEALNGLNEDLGDIDQVTASYADTVSEAEVAIERAGSSLDRTSLLLRLMLIVIASGGAVVGFALISIDRALARSIAPETLEESEEVGSYR